MPYYQYAVGLETSLAKSQHALESIEKDEETLFNTVLSRQKNKLIDLVDLFFPPRFKKKGGQYVFHPTLPSIYRKRALEFIKAAMESFQINVSFDCDIANIPGFNNLTAEKYDYFGFQCFKSYAVVDYDYAGKALVDETTLLGSFIDTVGFVELLIESDMLPLELLKLEIIFKIYMCWNGKRLHKLIEELKGEEGWPITEAISYAAGFYPIKSWISNGGYINELPNEPPLSHQPVRWKKDISQNMTESPDFNRPKGRIDNGQLSENIATLHRHWNKILKNAQQAMKFGDINHTGGENINCSTTRVREDGFFNWAKKKGYQYPGSLKLPKQKQTRTNPLHQIILDHRNVLIQKHSLIPTNEAIWSSIFKDWESKKIPFIDNMSRWRDHGAKIVWTSENGNPEKPSIMEKASFQKHMSKHSPK